MLCTWGVNNGFVWDYAAAGPQGLTPLHLAALLGDGGKVAHQLAGQLLPEQHVQHCILHQQLPGAVVELDARLVMLFHTCLLGTLARFCLTVVDHVSKVEQ